MFHVEPPPDDTDDQDAPAPLSYDQVDEALAYGTDEAPPEQLARVRSWLPRDEREAEWAMARIVELDTASRQADEQYDAWVDKYRSWHDRVTARIDSRRQFFAQAVEQYALAWHDQDPERNKTLDLPSGKVKTTTPQTATVDVIDPDQVAIFCTLTAVPDAVKTTTTVLVSHLRKVIKPVKRADDTWGLVDTRTGEPVVVPGTTISPPGPTTAKVAPIAGP